MDDFFAFTAHNIIVVALLALVVYGVTRVWRQPAVAHLLWVLVLLKLVTPPVFRITAPALGLPLAAVAWSKTLPSPRIESPSKPADSQVVDHVMPGTQEQSATSAIAPELSPLHAIWDRTAPLLLVCWLAGSIAYGLVAAIRILRFERLLRDTMPAPDRLQSLARECAARLGVRQIPGLRYVECVEGPFLWWSGRRPTIVLPMRLFRQLDDQQASMVLAHELAHLRRGDHWVRFIELIVATIYWWNPVVWMIRRQIHQAEDLCCDAWVCRAFSVDGVQRYAELLLQAAEFLNAAEAGTRLLPASRFLHPLSLKARITMILENRFAPSVSQRSLVVIALVALLVLPSFVQLTRTQAVAANDQPAAEAAQKEAPAPALDFPHVVPFEQGATRFETGDEITIREVRGTAETFLPGHIYMIKGTYKLASHDKALLAAYTTAMSSADGRSISYKVQTTVVNQGDGTFTLYMPMPCRGWPHVSFYPTGRGEGFGGNYFGTGDSVLKKWWGTKDADPKASVKRDPSRY